MSPPFREAELQTLRAQAELGHEELGHEERKTVSDHRIRVDPWLFSFVPIPHGIQPQTTAHGVMPATLHGRMLRLRSDGQVGNQPI
jgi:hypothetical protein